MEAGEKVLSSFESHLSDYALRRLRAQYCQVRLREQVTNVSVKIDDCQFY